MLPSTKKGMDMLEQADQNTTDMVNGLEHLSYKEILRELRWFNLKKRRLRGNPIDVYKHLMRNSKENR